MDAPHSPSAESETKAVALIEIHLTGETHALSEFCPGPGQDWAQKRLMRASNIVDISDCFPFRTWLN